ncbi:type IIL restriction-modification enzyme MmeI [Chryseobacterium koreense]
MPLKSNSGKSFQGSIVLGKGFILTPEEALALIDKDPRNKEVLFPYLNGDDLNNSPTQEPSRWVINFFDWSEEKARSYSDCFDIVERLVKPERDAYDESKNSWNKSVKTNWWQFGAWRKALERAISELDLVMVIPLVSKYSAFEFSQTNTVFMHKLGVLILNDFHSFAILSSSIHNLWCWKYSSTLGSGTLNYSTTDCFENYPFPQDNKKSLENVGKEYYHQRKHLMHKIELGLTKIYNIFHSKGIQEDIDSNDNHVRYLKKHLEKKPLISNYEDIIDDIRHLRKLHIQIDQAVLDIYGWNDIQLNHGFYELEYLPANDRVRFTIHPTARKEILKRLLLLNLQQYNEESKSDTFAKNIGKKRSKSIPKASNITLFPED